MKKTNNVCNVVSALLGAVALSLAGAAGAQKLAGNEIKIGVVVPVTGQAADVGKREAIGAQAAVDVINARGGIGGVPIKLYFADEGTNPQESISAVRKVTGTTTCSPSSDRITAAPRKRPFPWATG